MTSDSRWRRTEELYHAALERPESERAAFLLAACDDDALRRDVESLLAEGGADQFLTTPALELAGREMAVSKDVLIGRRVGSYEILSLLGAGGMGVVYRARDTKLQREVAIKVLPDAVAADPDRIARFAREARLLAALNHPHIATVYGLEEGDGISALVLELVEGETLAERLARGRLTSTEAIHIAKQIADGLEAAHDTGIVHRDLKPSNITLRSDGTVKILDFGLAKALAPGPDDPAATLTHRSSPTLMGVVTGTPAYMSPEQAQGQPVDKRTDIWAFGCVFFEMLTGQQAFAGRSIGETFAVVIATEPAWEALPPKTPPTVRSLLRRCLQKDLARRLRHISDARFQLEETVSDSDDRTPSASRSPDTTTALERALWTALVLLSVGAGVAGGVWWGGRAPVETSGFRLEINTPSTRNWTSLAISPDGTNVTFIGISDDTSRLWVRSLLDESTAPLKGTENAAFPFWSPNGRSIGFFADGQLKRIDLDTGAVQILGQASALGGTWNQDGTILFATGPGGGLFSITAEGRNRTQLLRPTLQANSPRFPHFLPDGRHYLFHTIGTEAGIYVGQLGASDGASPRRLIPDASAPVYASGHLFFAQQGTLFAQPFDATELRFTGEPTSVADRLVVTIDPGSAALSVSRAGHVVYRRRPAEDQHQFVWFDRFGKEIKRIPGSGIGSGFNASLSPNEGQLAIGDNSPGTTDIWLLDVNLGVPHIFTTDKSFDLTPVWSPNGDRIAFSSNRRAGTDFDLYVKRVAGGGDEELLIATENGPDVPSDWSSDGRFVLYTGGRDGNNDIRAISVADRTSFPVVETDATEENAVLSRDMRWVAYQSDKSGTSEIYVHPFRRQGSGEQVSAGGGAQVRWRENGEELFYLAPDDWLVAVPLRRHPTADRLIPDKPIRLFPTRRAGAARQGFNRHYSVSSDGQRFLIDTLTTAALPVTVILNWKPGR